MLDWCLCRIFSTLTVGMSTPHDIFRSITDSRDVFRFYYLKSVLNNFPDVCLCDRNISNSQRICFGILRCTLVLVYVWGISTYIFKATVSFLSYARFVTFHKSTIRSSLISGSCLSWWIIGLFIFRKVFLIY